MNQIEAQRIATIRANNPKYNSSCPVQYDNKRREIKDGNDKSMNALKWAGIIAAGALVVGGTIYAIKTGKQLKYERITDATGKTVQKVGGKVLEYSKDESGRIVAILDGKRAEGIMKFTTNNGTTLTYNNGILCNSMRRGKDAFEKLYDKSGHLKKATYRLADGTKNVIKHIYDKNSGKLIQIKDKINGETALNYNSNGKAESIIHNNEDLIEKAQKIKEKKLLPGKEWANSLGDMSETGVLKAQLEEKIADGQISNLDEAIKNGFTEEQIKKAGLYVRLTEPNRLIKLTANIPNDIKSKLTNSQLIKAEQIEEMIADGQISNLHEALEAGYDKNFLRTLGLIK